MDEHWEQYRKQGEQATAAHQFAHAEATWSMATLLAQNFDEKDPRLSYCLDSLAHALLREGKFQLAEVFLSRSWHLKSRVLGASQLELARTLNMVAEVFYHQKRFGEAVSICRRVFEVYEASYGEAHPSTKVARDNLSLIEKMHQSHSGEAVQTQKVVTPASAPKPQSHPSEPVEKHKTSAAPLPAQTTQPAQAAAAKPIDDQPAQMTADLLRGISRTVRPGEETGKIRVPQELITGAIAPPNLQRDSAQRLENDGMPKAALNAAPQQKPVTPATNTTPATARPAAFPQPASASHPPPPGSAGATPFVAPNIQLPKPGQPGAPAPQGVSNQRLPATALPPQSQQFPQSAARPATPPTAPSGLAQALGQRPLTPTPSGLPASPRPAQPAPAALAADITAKPVPSTPSGVYRAPTPSPGVSTPAPAAASGFMNLPLAKPQPTPQPPPSQPQPVRPTQPIRPRQLDSARPKCEVCNFELDDGETCQRCTGTGMTPIRPDERLGGMF